jgi:hypothetical protein
MRKFYNRRSYFGIQSSNVFLLLIPKSSLLYLNARVNRLFRNNIMRDLFLAPFFRIQSLGLVFPTIFDL